MKFALLGDDPTVRPLLRAVLRAEGHELVVAAGAGSLAAEILEAAPRLQVTDEPADVLVTPEVEVAIVCGPDPATLETAKRLAAEGTPLVIVPDARQELAAIYELSLVRDDARVRLVPFSPRLFDRELDELRRRRPSQDKRETTAESQWWRLERTAAGRRLEAVDVAVPLLEDVLVLQSLGGTFERVTALRTGEEGTTFTASTVTLAGATGPEVTWTIRGGGEVGWRLAVDAGDASALNRNAEWELAGSVADDALVGLVRALREAEAPTHPTWSEMVRAFEVVDAARRSVKRRRTIDLLYETTSERNQFKSQMAAGGCAMLMYVLFVSVLLASTGSLGAGRTLLRGILPWLLLLPVVAFLGLQFLYFVARPTGADSDTEPSSEG